MVNGLKKNISPLPAGKYGTSTKQSTRWRHQANEAKCSLEADRVRTLGEWRSLQYIKKLSAEKRYETHYISNEEKVKWIEDYVERETAVASTRVQDIETMIMQAQKDMSTDENAGGTTQKPEKTFHEMLDAITDSVNDLASSDHEQDAEHGEDEEEDTELGKLSDDDEPGWVIGTISKTVQHHLESCRQKQMRLDELTQLGWRNAANYFCVRDMMYGTAK